MCESRNAKRSGQWEARTWADPRGSVGVGKKYRIMYPQISYIAPGHACPEIRTTTHGFRVQQKRMSTIMEKIQNKRKKGRVN